MIRRKLNKFQPGGAVPQEQGQAPQMPVEEIVMQVKQALEQGADIVEIAAGLLQQMDEQQVITILETIGVPAEQIQQIMAEVMQGQGGGEPGMGGQEEQMQQLIMAFAQISGTSPEEIMAQLQQAPPEQQQQMMQQMMQAVQQAQQGGGQQMAPEQGGQPMMQMGGQAGNQEEQMMQLIQEFAQIVGANPEDIVADIQEASEEEQQEMVQQMIDTVQQAQGGQGQPQQMAIPQARKGVNVEEAVVNHIVSKMLQGGITKKDFQAIAKDMIKEMSKGGATEFDTSSKDNFIANIKGATSNYTGKNLEVRKIKDNVLNVIKALQGLKDNPGFDSLPMANNGIEVEDDEPEEKTTQTTGVVGKDELVENIETDKEVKGAAEDNKSKFDMDAFLKALAAGYGEQDPFGKKQRPPIFGRNVTGTVRGFGDLEGKSAAEMQERFENLNEGESIQQTKFAKNLFGKNITNEKRINRRADRGANRSGVRWDIMGAQADVPPTAEAGVEIGNKSNITVDYSNLLDRTIGGMHDFNRLAEQYRGFDAKRELADRQKVFTAVDTLDPGTYDPKTGKFNPKKMGTGEYAGTGNDSFARGRAISDFGMYGTSQVDTGELGLIVKKLGGTIDKSGVPRFPDENKILEKALKYLDSKGVKYRK